MAKPSVAEIIWIFNTGTGQVDIVEDGKALESCQLRDAAQRLSYHRHQAAKATGRTFVETRATKRVRA